MAGTPAMIVIRWLGFSLLVQLITAGFATFRTIDGSLWEPMTQLPRWLAFGAGIQLTGVYMRIHVAHGQTRRGFMRQASVYLLAFAALLATLGYLMELAIYRMADWPQTFTRDYLFDSASHIAPILFTYGLVYLVWTVAGALIAATFRRPHWYGLVVVAPFCLATIAGIELADGARHFAPLTIVDIGVRFPVRRRSPSCPGSAASPSVWRDLGTGPEYAVARRDRLTVRAASRLLCVIMAFLCESGGAGAATDI